MLLSENRLKKKRDFDLLFKEGHWINGQFFDLKYLNLEKVSQLPKKLELIDLTKELKIAFAVSLKISKKAVLRNRLKRLIREVVRLLIKEKKITTGYYLLFVAKNGSLELSIIEIKNAVEYLLQKAKILK